MFNTALLTLMLVTSPMYVAGQGRGQGAGNQAVGRTAAPYDITGYWVALVTDDWRYRMLTPPKGNVDYLPVNPEGRRVTEGWDAAKDEASGEECRAYGAGGVMRLPGRLHITWENDNTLRIDTEAGTQTRHLLFGSSQAPAGDSWQGYSVARWELPGGRGQARGAASGRGQLKVVTTHLRSGYLRKNGVPYSSEALITEYFLRLVDRRGQEYLAVTMIVDDPRYLQQPYIKTYEFKKQSDSSGWNPTPCSAK